MQSLHLGLQYIGQRLAAQEEDHGVRFYRPDNLAEPIDWRQFWYGRTDE